MANHGFLLFVFVLLTSKFNLNWKKHRCCARDSNLGPQTDPWIIKYLQKASSVRAVSERVNHFGEKTENLFQTEIDFSVSRLISLGRKEERWETTSAKQKNGFKTFRATTTRLDQIHFGCYQVLSRLTAQCTFLLFGRHQQSTYHLFNQLPSTVLRSLPTAYHSQLDFVVFAHLSI